MKLNEIAPPADFFIIYTETDKPWAEWIAWCLEEAGYSVILQAWDFRPGNNFVVMMNIAVRAHRTVAVLSPAFLEAAFVQPEWAAAFREDPTGVGRKIIPVRVKDCQAEKSLLAQIVYIDLVKCPRDAARSILLAGIREGRAKPQNEPPFPGISAK